MTIPSPEPEKSYRVWVEQQRCGWIVVDAPNEATARDRAEDIVNRDWWTPETTRATPLTVEECTP